MDGASFCDAHHVLDSAQADRSEAWLKTFEKTCLTKLLQASSTSQSAVKIAILDTGIASAHPRFKEKIGPTKPIRDIVEFMDGKLLSKAGDDTEGHGTHTVALLARLAPMALIYVARIGRTTKDIAPTDVAAVRIGYRFLVVQTCTDIYRLFAMHQTPGMWMSLRCLLASPA
jgi:hypothetical protein